MFAAVLFFAALAGPSSIEALAWQKLQRGMPRDRVAEIVGVPLMQNAARGHEVWTYDGGAYAQFHGGVLTAWTSPKPARPPQPGSAIATSAGTKDRTAAPRRS